MLDHLRTMRPCQQLLLPSMHLALAAVLICLAHPSLAGSDAAPSTDDEHQRLDQSYRTCLANVAKVYQSEVARFESVLKRESVSRRNDQAAQSAIAEFRDAIKAGKLIDDLKVIANDDLLGSGRITGSSDALLGKWHVVTDAAVGPGEYTLELKPNGTGSLTIDVNSSVINRVVDWHAESGSVIIHENNPGVPTGTRVTWEVNLPIPIADSIPLTYRWNQPGNVMIAKCSIVRLGGK